MPVVRMTGRSKMSCPAKLRPTGLQPVLFLVGLGQFPRGLDDVTSEAVEW
jgi:hypothetical protein